MFADADDPGADKPGDDVNPAPDDQPSASVAAEEALSEGAEGTGVVPFLQDVLAAFISTLLLMVFGVNFVIFTSLSLDGLNSAFNVGGRKCAPPCLNFPSLEVVHDAMDERAMGLRRVLCTDAYGRQDIVVNSETTLKNQQCAGCNPIWAWVLIIWDGFLWFCAAIWGIVRSLLCGTLKIIRALVSPITLAFGMIAKMIGAGSKAMSAGATTTQAVGAAATAEASKLEAEQGGGGRGRRGGRRQRGGSPEDDPDDDQTGGAGFKDKMRSAGSTAASGARKVGSMGAAGARAAGRGAKTGFRGAKGAAGAVFQKGFFDGVGQALADIFNGLGCCDNDYDCKVGEDGKPLLKCGRGSKCRGPAPELHRKCPGNYEGKPPPVQELADAANAELLAKKKAAASTAADAAEMKAMRGEQGGGSRRRAVKTKLGGSSRRRQRGGGASDKETTAHAEGAGRGLNPVLGIGRGGLGIHSKLKAKEEELLRNASKRRGAAGASGHPDDMDPSAEASATSGTWCAGAGRDGCIDVEQGKMGYGMGAGVSEIIRREALEAARFKQIVDPPWPYSLWFKRNRKEALQIARTGGVGQEPIDAYEERMTKAASRNYPSMTAQQVHAWVNERVNYELGRRAEQILEGHPDVHPHDLKGAYACDTSKTAQEGNTGIFPYVGGRAAPASVTGSTPFEDEEWFGGKWGNWMAASSSSTAIGYRRVMRTLSLWLSGEPGTTSPTPVWVRLLVATIIYLCVGASVMYLPSAIWGVAYMCTFVHSLWCHVSTAPLAIGWPFSGAVGLWGVFASFVVAPIQAIMQALQCVFYLTVHFVIRYWKVAKLEMFGRAWGPGLILFAVLVNVSAWNRFSPLKEHDYTPIAISIATAAALYLSLSKWWKASQ